MTTKAITRDGNSLLAEGAILLENIPPGTTLEEDANGCGVFVSLFASETNSRQVFAFGSVPTLERFVACHRYEPYWMKPVVGTRLSQVPSETQFLLCRLNMSHGDRWLLVVPLFGELFRFSLRAAIGGFTPTNLKLEHLEIVGETGDPFAPGLGDLAAFVACGEDPFELCRVGACSVRNKLRTCRLREDKPLPDFCDRFGWCTWDAFYQEVSEERVRQGLESFARGGVAPRWMILDDGWQSASRQPTGEKRLTSFSANEKFPGGLRQTIDMAKREFSVERFIVWQTIVGYWGGTDADSFPEYRIFSRARRFGEGIMEHRPTFNEQWWGSLVGVVHPQDAARFFDDYHKGLSAEGVDGVKVDQQAVLEGVASEFGGRVPLTMAYRRGLEASVQKHFAGRLINCMSNGQETWYGGNDSTLLRSSIDFFPKFAQSHGAHVYANAEMGVWFGHFMQPDWDMFQSGHDWGAFHAAARAISGGPVYVSDKPGEHDFELLRKLVTSDGTVLRCDQPGMPTLDTLCIDPTEDDVLFKIQNKNGEAGIIGVFNCRYSETEAPEIAGHVATRDVRGLSGARHACFAHVAQSLELLGVGQRRELTLAQGAYELFTLVPVESDFAAIGLIDKFNSRGAVEAVFRSAEGVRIALRDGGDFVAWCEQKVVRAECDGSALEYRQNGTRLDVEVPRGGRREVLIGW